MPEPELVPFLSSLPGYDDAVREALQRQAEDHLDETKSKTAPRSTTIKIVSTVSADGDRKRPDVAVSVKGQLAPTEHVAVAEIEVTGMGVQMRLFK